MTAVPEWMRPPRLEGWFADDLDHLPEAPRHTELIDGALVFMMSPQRAWHAWLVTNLVVALADQAPPGIEAAREMTIRLDERNRPEPDLLLTTRPFAPEDEESLPVVHVYELDGPTRSYVATGIHRHELRTSVPFAIKLELDALVPGRPR
jgi:hypothetical protein